MSGAPRYEYNTDAAASVALQVCVGPEAEAGHHLHRHLHPRNQQQSATTVELADASSSTSTTADAPTPASSSTASTQYAALASFSFSSQPASPVRSVSEGASRNPNQNRNRSQSRDSAIGPAVPAKTTPPVPSRRSSALTVTPDQEYKLTRSISASITAVLAGPQPLPPLLPQEQLPLPRVPSSTSTGGSRSGSSSLASPAANSFSSSSSKKSYFMTSAYSRRQQAEALAAASAAAAAAANNVAPTNGHVDTSPAQGISPRAAHGQVVETTNKRIATLEYMRKVYEGDVHHFSTISHNSSQLSTLPSLAGGRIGRRATNYLLLGTSIPPLLALYGQSPLNYLKALTSLVNEFETFCTLSLEAGNSLLRSGRVGQMLKSGMRGVKARRTSAAADSLMSPDSTSANGSSLNLSNPSSLTSPQESTSPQLTHHMINLAGHEFHYLQTPNLPFDPDFNTSFGTLIDILTAAYQDLLTLLEVPESCTVAVVEAYAKADKAIRKTLINAMANEMAESTRKEAKVEVGGLGKMVLSGLM